jgi:ABC-type antimicrobial peptide transport system permease subunit
VGDTRTYYAKEIIPEAYIPFTLSGPANFSIVMSPKTGDPRALVPVLRAAISELDKDQPVMDTEPVDYFIARYVSAGPKFSVVLFGAFGFLGLALVTVGIYGVIANAVARRTREIGLRMAVGATMADVMRMVIGRGVRLLAIGVVVGLAGGLSTAAYLQTLLRGGTPYDPVSLTAVIVILAFTGVVACWLPARRAARIAPMDALRVE